MRAVARLREGGVDQGLAEFGFVLQHFQDEMFAEDVRLQFAQGIDRCPHRAEQVVARRAAPQRQIGGQGANRLRPRLVIHRRNPEAQGREGQRGFMARKRIGIRALLCRYPFLVAFAIDQKVEHLRPVQPTHRVLVTLAGGDGVHQPFRHCRGEQRAGQGDDPLIRLQGAIIDLPCSMDQQPRFWHVSLRKLKPLHHQIDNGLRRDWIKFNRGRGTCAVRLDHLCPAVRREDRLEPFARRLPLQQQDPDGEAVMLRMGCQPAQEVAHRLRPQSRIVDDKKGRAARAPAGGVEIAKFGILDGSGQPAAFAQFQGQLQRQPGLALAARRGQHHPAKPPASADIGDIADQVPLQHIQIVLAPVKAVRRSIGNARDGGIERLERPSIKQPIQIRVVQALQKADDLVRQPAHNVGEIVAQSIDLVAIVKRDQGFEVGRMVDLDTMRLGIAPTQFCQQPGLQLCFVGGTVMDTEKAQ